MQPFLEKLAHYVHSHYGEKLSELCLVLPNRRAKIFFKNYLSTVYSQPVWSPTIFSIEDFISELSGSESIDTLSLAFEFYSVYQKIEQEKAQPVDDFLQWAPTLLHDFNEMDQYLVDATALFDYLSDDKALSLWNPEGKELSEFQKKYLKFWKSLAHYYQELNIHLKEKKLMYPGLAYRKVAENVVQLAAAKRWHKIIFAGFNALNTAEKQLFTLLGNAGKADILWDADEYYLQDENQEAGKFLRGYEKSMAKMNPENTFLWLTNNLQSEKKRIVIAGVAQQIGQAKVAATLLDEIIDAGQGNLKKCALVLADENLLMPVLHSIPSSIDNFNVTMGYPIGNLSLHTYVDLFFGLQENAVKYGKSATANKVRFYYKDVKKFLLHPYTSILLCSEESKDVQDFSVVRSFVHSLERQNLVFLSQVQLIQIFKELNERIYSVLKFVFEPWENKVDACLAAICKLLETLKRGILQKSKQSDALELEIVFQYTKITNRIQSLVHATSVESFRNVSTIHSVFKQLVKQQSIAFIGEPLDGLQIMGMLETRTLDFETVVLLSSNEGVLPAGKKENSFIPMELKSKFGLPTYSDKDAIFGYHFYRLLQCAKTIYLVYNTETDEFGSGERSRFIAQLQHELPLKNKNITIEEKLFTLALPPNSTSQQIEIEKNDFVFERFKLLMDSGMSPSLFNAYRNCTLQFYFKYIAGLSEQEEPDESIDAATFGTVIHAVLEENYLPLLGEFLSSENLKSAFQDTALKVESALKKIYKNGDLTTGKNLLNVKIAEKYIDAFLEAELKHISDEENATKKIKLLHLEKALSTPIRFGSHTILLSGKADRIDSIGNRIRIIDYKTGAVDESKELKLNDWENLKEVKRNKAFQLLMYAYLYSQSEDDSTLEISSGIFSFRELSKGLKPVSLAGNAVFDKALLTEFELELRSLLEEMLNSKLPFAQTKDKSICEYCSFKTICNR